MLLSAFALGLTWLGVVLCSPQLTNSNIRAAAGEWALNPTNSSYGPIESWNVSGVTDLTSFAALLDFPANLSTWDVSRVTSMVGAFSQTSNFNSDISSWDTVAVTDMTAMFFVNQHFNSDISVWDVSRVESMVRMFSVSQYFRGDLNSWDVMSVTSMQEMFAYTVADWKVNDWDVVNVRNMEAMFYTSAQNSDLGTWDVAQVTTMRAMFGEPIFGGYGGELTDWDVRNVVDMTSMFSGYEALLLDLGVWDISGLRVMDGMFAETGFDGDLSTWDTSGVTSMSGVFSDFWMSDMFRRDLGPFWDVTAVTRCNSFCARCGLPNFTACVPCDPVYTAEAGGQYCECPDGEAPDNNRNCISGTLAPTTPPTWQPSEDGSDWSSGAPTGTPTGTPRTPTQAPTAATVVTQVCATTVVTSAAGTFLCSAPNPNSTVPAPVLNSDGTVTVTFAGNGGDVTDTLLSPSVSIVLVDGDGGTVHLDGEVVFTLPLPLLSDNTSAVGMELVRTEDACGTTTVVAECAWWNPMQTSWERSGCVSEHVDEGVQCRCTHLTEFALVARQQRANKAVCQVPVSGVGHYILAGCFFLVAVCATVQSVRLLLATAKKSSSNSEELSGLVRHGAIACAAVLRGCVLILRAEQLPASLLVILASLPYAMEFLTVADTAWSLAWSLQQKQLTDRHRAMYFGFAFFCSFLILAAGVTMALAQGNEDLPLILSYVMACLVLAVCLAVLVAGTRVVIRLRQARDLTATSRGGDRMQVDVVIALVVAATTVALMLQSVCWALSVQLALVPQGATVLQWAVIVDIVFYAMGLLLLSTYLLAKARSVNRLRNQASKSQTQMMMRSID